ncbi:hypothetical protein [Amycolatopsis sp. Hca4]|uniref:hypothetical protein n=1 Tax=Amycolatopsis sp. Hca4 TaxID=2742131 RepID=UPI0015925F44|nr:hypothetical protein [Amycolatopsis sp. Hca4]QKV79940.1 hypothetical protein HUT10_43670 [Amycolatopsis sp. Hca4]
MTTERGAVWAGDYLRAMHALGPEGVDPAVVSKLLGFVEDEAETQDLRLAAPVVPVARADEEPPPGDSSSEEVTDGLPSPASSGEASRPALEPGTAERPVQLDWAYEYAQPGVEPPWKDAALLDTGSPALRPAPVHEPLFARRVERGILQTALSRPERAGEVDMPALVDIVSAGRPVQVLPRLPVPTLRFGVRILVDEGWQMAPFRRDRAALVASVRALTGRSATTVRYFAGTPEPTAADRCPPGSRILVVSCFDILAFAECDRSVWQDLVSRWRERDLTAVALVPFPAARIPGWLSRLVPVVVWDRTTTASTVRAALAAERR